MVCTLSWHHFSPPFLRLLSLPNRFLHLPRRRSHRVHGGGDAAHHVVGRFLGDIQPRKDAYGCVVVLFVLVFLLLYHILLLKGVVVFLCFISFCWFVKIAVVRGVCYIYGFMVRFKEKTAFYNVSNRAVELSCHVKTCAPSQPWHDQESSPQNTDQMVIFFRKISKKNCHRFGVWCLIPAILGPIEWPKKEGPRFLQSPPPFQWRLASLQQDRFMKKAPWWC